MTAKWWRRDSNWNGYFTFKSRRIQLTSFRRLSIVANTQAALCVVVAAFTFFAWPRVSSAWRLTSTDEWVFWTDTLGLGVFASSGARTAATLTALGAGKSPLAAADVP